MNQISCCVFDLETTNLNADFGVVLCGVVLPADGEPKVFRADKYATWRRHRSDDSQVVKAIVAELEKWDIWIAHNGQFFDVPFLRTRLALHRLPPLATAKLLDPCLLARRKLKMSFNSLERLASFLGVNTKTEVDSQMWLKASLDGDKDAMTYIVDHCVQDVITLEKVVGAIKSYSSNLNGWGSSY
jgi:DNA polymerase III epsilon subunit-like protein